MSTSYHDILAAKRIAFEARGLDRVPALNPQLKPHQAHSVEFALRTGCAALFLDTGLGKTFCELEWARVLVEATNGPALMIAPLAVGRQHVREADRFGIDAVQIREMPARLDARVYIVNYEMLHKIDLGAFDIVVLDESSILKSFAGKTTNAMIQAFARARFRMAATATPAPNDHTELGQHAAFLGVMQAREMLMRWFVNDTSTASQDWRLKGHAAASFWDWVASWARCVSRPSDLGYSDEGYVLPALNVRRIVVAADRSHNPGEETNGQARLFRMPELSATSVNREKKITIEGRADALAARVAGMAATDPYVAWVDTNAEADALMARLAPMGFLEVRGDMKPEIKEDRLVAFSEGQLRGLVTKTSIAGFGLNWQHCCRTGFMGRSFSYESYYQAIRRFWRFGQTRPVDVDDVMADTEAAIADVVGRKEHDHAEMKREMAAAMARVVNPVRAAEDYRPTRRVEIPHWLRSVAA